MTTIIPRTGNVQRVGLDRTLVRMTAVDIGSNVACVGGGALHLARGVRFSDGSPVCWYVTDERARGNGWI